MTRTQYFTATSIDGYIADADNSLGWLFEADAAGSEASRSESGESSADDPFASFFAEVGAMAMGATTYEWVLDHEKLIERPDRWQTIYGDLPTWVFTHRTLPTIPGANLRFVADDVVGTHEAMVTAAAGRNVWLVGGGDLVGQFSDHGLLDEIILGMAPVTLGSGAPVLPRRLTSTTLSLVRLERIGGFAYLTYRLTH